MSFLALSIQHPSPSSFSVSLSLPIFKPCSNVFVSLCLPYPSFSPPFFVSLLISSFLPQQSSLYVNLCESSDMRVLNSQIVQIINTVSLEYHNSFLSLSDFMFVVLLCLKANELPLTRTSFHTNKHTHIILFIQIHFFLFEVDFCFPGLLLHRPLHRMSYNSFY